MIFIFLSNSNFWVTFVSETIHCSSESELGCTFSKDGRHFSLVMNNLGNSLRHIAWPNMLMSKHFCFAVVLRYLCYFCSFCVSSIFISWGKPLIIKRLQITLYRKSVYVVSWWWRTSVFTFGSSLTTDVGIINVADYFQFYGDLRFFGYQDCVGDFYGILSPQVKCFKEKTCI